MFTTITRGRQEDIEFHPTIPVVCSSSLQCSLRLHLRVLTEYIRPSCDYISSDPPFSVRKCEVNIRGHLPDEDWETYKETPNKLTVYGKPTYELNNIRPERIKVVLYNPDENFQHSLWSNFNLSFTVSIN